MQIRVGDEVEVISGAYRKERGKVKEIRRAAGKVVVEGVNLGYKHVKPSQKNQKGGRLSFEMPMAISKVMLVCPSCNKASRTGVRLQESGAKEGFCKKCGSTVRVIAPAPAKAGTAGAASQS